MDIILAGENLRPNGKDVPTPEECRMDPGDG